MSTTVTMWLGIAFVVLAVGAVLLQAWLWGFPMQGEKGTPSYKSTAPRAWTNIHRLMGYSYGVIYILMMWEMLPRLWEYQVELPARTVIHAVAGITIGCILFSKIAVLRFFKHFEASATPLLGMGLLFCTIILAVLSLPFSLRAHDLGGRAMSEQNVERVTRIIGDIDMHGDIPPEQLITAASFSRGREILVRKCVLCHDLRTILAKPRTGKRWHDVVVRMADKPVIGDPIALDDVPWVTTYLIAITPDIQQSRRRKEEQDRAQAKAAAEIEEIVDDEDFEDFEEVEDVEDIDAGTATAAPAKPKKPSAGAGAGGKALVNKRCTECHDLDLVEEAAPLDAAGWAGIVQLMVEEEGAEVTPKEARKIVAYLAKSYGG